MTQAKHAASCPVHRIVEAIAELTLQKSLLAMEDCFFALMRDIWPNMECWLVKTPWDDYPTPENLIVHGDRATLPVDMALVAMQLHGRETIDQLARGGRHYLNAHIPQPDDEEAELLLLASPRALDDDDKRLLQALVQIYCNHLELLQAGDRDLLTGALSRKVLQNRMTDQLAARLHGRRYREDGNADYLGVLNLDSFRRINAQHGHRLADQVLAETARVISESLHEGDMVFRQVSDGFAFLLFDIELGMAREVCTRLRQNLAEHTFVADIRLTARAGYCAMPHDRLPQEILEHARAALEFAKAEGHDPVMDYADLADQGLIGDAGGEKTVDLFLAASRGRMSP
jgi:diguanylate cyclase (GGDEF)-like protein